MILLILSQIDSYLSNNFSSFIKNNMYLVSLNLLRYPLICGSSQVKHLINKKVLRKKLFKKNKSSQSFAMFQSFQSQLSLLIATLKNKYYSKVSKNY